MENQEEVPKPYLSVVVPAYTEEKRIGITLSAIHSYLQRQPYTWEIMVVLDGPDDRTSEIVRNFAAAHNQVRYIDRTINRGKGYTVRQGMLAADGAVRLFTDADNSTDMTHFDKMRPLLEAGADVVIASRDRKDAPSATQTVPQPPLKRLLGNLGNLVIQALVIPGIWDTRCGFKAFKADAAEEVFSHARMDGWSFDDEALALARRYGYDIQAVAANWVDAEGTHVTKLDYLRNIWEALHIRWNLMTGVYEEKREKKLSING